MGKALIIIVCAAVCVACVVAGAMAWTVPANGPAAGFRWSMRIGAIVVGSLSLLILLGVALRRELVPDFISKIPGRRFGNDGVVFTFQMVQRDGIGWLAIHYQNEYEKAAQAKVVVRPAQNFLLTRNNIDLVTADIPCGPAAYGVVEIPLAIQSTYQGKNQLFDVGASVSYPNDQGMRLRSNFANDMSSADLPGAADAVVSAVRVGLTGNPSSALTVPSRVKLRLPVGVQKSAQGLPEVQHHEEWTLPDDFDPQRGAILDERLS